MEELKYIFVDDHSGFWLDDESKEEWKKLFPENETLLIPYFNPGNDASSSLFSRINSHSYRIDQINWKEICIVSDSMFYDDRYGGAKLLQALRQKANREFKRAVIYSQEELLNDFCIELGSAIVRAVHKTGKFDVEKIKKFLDAGVFSTLDPFWELIGVITSLEYCLHAALTKVQTSGKPIYFPEMEKYGIIPQKLSNEFVFSPLLQNDESARSTLYAVASIRDVFSDLTFEEMNSELKNPIFEGFHPFKSLKQESFSMTAGCKAHPVRILWELLNTGANSELLCQHYKRDIDELLFRERIWLRNQLRALGETFQSLGEDINLQTKLFKDCAEAIKDLNKIKQAIIDSDTGEL